MLAVLWAIFKSWAHWRAGESVLQNRTIGLVFTDLPVNLFVLQVKDTSYNFCQISNPNSSSKLEVSLEIPSSSWSPILADFGSRCPCTNPLAFSWTVGFLQLGSVHCLQTAELNNSKCTFMSVTSAFDLQDDLYWWAIFFPYVYFLHCLWAFQTAFFLFLSIFSGAFYWH